MLESASVSPPVGGSEERTVSFLVSGFRISALAACLSVLAACGGGDGDLGHSSSAADDARYLPTLVDDEGLAMPSVSTVEPTDNAAHTRDRRYASREQAERLSDALGTSAMTVELSRDDAAIFDSVVQAHANRAAREQGAVFVRASDLRLGAAFVDRLAAAGVENVWLVTQ